MTSSHGEWLCCTNEERDYLANPVWQLGCMSKPTSPGYKTRNRPAHSGPAVRHWFEQPPAVHHRLKPDGGGERAQAPWVADDLV